MNMPLLSPAGQRGNAFVYILIAVVLFAGLSFVLSRSQDSNPSAEISDASVQTAVSSILTYEAAARSAIERMQMDGASIDQIDFTRPSSATFNNAPTTTKLFHPDGGGLQYKPLPKAAIGGGPSTPPGFYIGRFNNFAWTSTTAQDVIFSAFALTKSVCEELNRKITGNPTPPDTSTIGIIVDPAITGVAGAEMTKSVCPLCENRSAICYKKSNANEWAYYSILVAR